MHILYKTTTELLSENYIFFIYILMEKGKKNSVCKLSPLKMALTRYVDPNLSEETLHLCFVTNTFSFTSL